MLSTEDWALTYDISQGSEEAELRPSNLKHVLQITHEARQSPAWAATNRNDLPMIPWGGRVPLSAQKPRPEAVCQGL